MTIGRSARVVLSAGAMLLAMAAGASAQTNDDTFPQFQWNFSTPGARANAMGRAFIGMADDATATVSNPAGLVNLTRPQVYVEYKNTDLKIDRLAAENSLFTGSATTTSKDLNQLSFFTFSAPLGEAKRFAVGVTYQRYLDYQESFNLAPRPIPNSPTFSAFRPVTGNADFKGDTFGVTASAVVTKMLDVGVTVLLNRLDANASDIRNNISFGPTYPPNGSNVNDLSTTTIQASETTIDQTKSAASFDVGALFKPSDKFSIGVTFAQGPKFTVSENLLVNPGFPNTNQAFVQFVPSSNFPPFPRAVHVNVPNRFGIGLAARPDPRWTFAADVVRINYSSLADNFTLIFDGDVFVTPGNTTQSCTPSSTVTCLDVPTLTGKEYSIANVWETHVGAEFNLLTGDTPLFVRGGVFTNPDHTVKFNGFSSSTLPAQDVQEINAEENATYNTLKRKNDVRGTAGIGVVLGQNVQVDLAYVFGKEFVASAAYRFK